MISEQHTIRDIFQPEYCQHFSATKDNTDTLSIRLSEAMGAVLDTDPHALDSLYNVVDPEALNDIFTPNSHHRPSTEIIFSWHNHAIRIQQPGEIHITNEPLVPELDANLSLATDFSSVPASSPQAISHEYAATENVGTEVILAVADASGVSPREVTERLADQINPEALTDLFQPLADGTPRTDGYVSFGFEGYFVIVSAEGVITICSELTQLKEKGGNILIVGDVPCDVFNDERAYLMKDSSSNRYDLFALLDRSPTELQHQATPVQLTPGQVDILDYKAPVRSTSAAATSPQGTTCITPITGTLADLQHALIQSVAMHEHAGDGRTTDAQLYVDSLLPVIDEPSTDVTTFLKPICRAVRGVNALGYFSLPIDRDMLSVYEIESAFDAMIELRVTEHGPEQRWLLPETGYTTEWFSIIDDGQRNKG